MGIGMGAEKNLSRRKYVIDVHPAEYFGVHIRTVAAQAAATAHSYNFLAPAAYGQL